MQHMHTIIISAVILYNFVHDLDIGSLAINSFQDFEMIETHEKTYNICLSIFIYLNSSCTLAVITSTHYMQYRSSYILEPCKKG